MMVEELWSKSMLWLVVVVVVVGVAVVEGEGECGRGTTPEMEAMRLVPCVGTSPDENSWCCAQLKRIAQNAKCLCAVMLSNTANISNVNPRIAITIPKRCNIADRPVGYKCGDYTFI